MPVYLPLLELLLKKKSEMTHCLRVVNRTMASSNFQASFTDFLPFTPRHTMPYGSSCSQKDGCPQGNCATHVLGLHSMGFAGLLQRLARTLTWFASNYYCSVPPPYGDGVSTSDKHKGKWRTGVMATFWVAQSHTEDELHRRNSSLPRRF